MLLRRSLFFKADALDISGTKRVKNEDKRLRGKAVRGSAIPVIVPNKESAVFLVQPNIIRPEIKVSSSAVCRYDEIRAEEVSGIAIFSRLLYGEKSLFLLGKFLCSK